MSSSIFHLSPVTDAQKGAPIRPGADATASILRRYDLTSYALARYQSSKQLAGNDQLPKDVSSRFGRRLRELRLQRGMTQSDMAKRFGIDRSYISDVERGRKAISLPLIEVIALGMDISLSKLFDSL